MYDEASPDLFPQTVPLLVVLLDAALALRIDEAAARAGAALAAE